LNKETIKILREKYKLDDSDLEISLTRINELNIAIEKIKAVEIKENLNQTNPLKFYNE
jgi:hypothetical protein